MFQKQKVSFNSKEVFDSKFKANIDTCFCVVSKLLFNNIINIDGSIDIDKAILLKKFQLWSYIYYLYFFNNKVIPEFIAMKTAKNDKASAILFYDTVMKTVNEKNIQNAKAKVIPFDINTLIYFINIIIHKYEHNMTNPVIDYLNKILEKQIIPSLGSISIRTGTNSGNVKIITNPQNVSNSNVKVKLTMAENK